jgi:hypothetical protein
MSGVVSARVVDWPRLLEHKEKLKGEQGGQWFLNTEDSETWVERAPGWRSDSHPWTDAGIEYDTLRHNLDRKTRQLFDRFFGTFFVGKQRGCAHITVRELDAKELDPSVFYITMSPATVQQYAQLASSLSFELLEGPYKEDCGLRFDSFREYLQQWVDLLQHAARGNKGVVISLLF